MGSCNSKEAEVSAKQKKLNDDLARIEALTLPQATPQARLQAEQLA